MYSEPEQPADASGADRPAVTRPRPGHADLAGVVKYGHDDIRDVLERASARETAARVAIGSIARQLLCQLGTDIVSHVISIGSVVGARSAGADLCGGARHRSPTRRSTAPTRTPSRG